MKFAFNLQDEVSSPLSEEPYFEDEHLKQEGIRPRKFFASNSKTGKEIIGKQYDDEPFFIPLKKVKGKQVNTIVSLDYDKENTPVLERLNTFDRLVSNAITSLYVAGNNHVTDRQIFYTYTGNHNTEPTNEELELIRRSVDKQSLIKASIDCKEELEKLYPNAEIKVAGSGVGWKREAQRSLK